MVANVKYHVITVVSIFLAIGIGIFVGFMLDAQGILTSQKEDIVSQLEDRFDYLREENQKIKQQSEDIKEENKRFDEFSRLVYSELVRDRLKELKVAIIETNDDYAYTDINQTLLLAGASVGSNTTINDILFKDEKKLKEIYNGIIVSDQQGEENIKEVIIRELTLSIITGQTTTLVQSLKEQGFINISGTYNEPVQYIIIAGGSHSQSEEKYRAIDENIVNVARKNNIPIIGVEKEDVSYSYVDFYKNSRISSVDNIDTVIGKVTLVLAMDGYPGNFGIKSSSESLTPTMTHMHLDK